MLVLLDKIQWNLDSEGNLSSPLHTLSEVLSVEPKPSLVQYLQSNCICSVTCDDALRIGYFRFMAKIELLICVHVRTCVCS